MPYLLIMLRKCRGQNLSVGHHANEVGIQRPKLLHHGLILKRLRLNDGNLMRQRKLLHRGGRELHAPVLGGVDFGVDGGVIPSTHDAVPYGTIGEICISGPTVMQGYLDKPKETAQTLQLHEDGGSSRYILTCINSSTSIPEPEDTADSTDQTQAPATTEQSPESNEKAASGIPTLHIILFAGGMVIAIGTLIVMQVLKKKRENEAPDDEEDEE